VRFRRVGRVLAATGMALLSLAVAGAIFVLEVLWFGFWDGHITDLERAEMNLFNAFAVVRVVWAIVFVVLAFKALRSAPVQDAAGGSGTDSWPRRLLVAAAGYGITLIVFWGIARYLRLILDAGAGG
jgi:hypothetical protein